jgi:hypothetical protein
MFRRISTIVVFSILLISISFAQDVKKTGGLARLSAMGGNRYVIDPFFNTVNTAWNGVYNNYILADLGTSADDPFSPGGYGQYISGSFSAGSNLTFGGILARDDFPGFGVALLDPGDNGNMIFPLSGVVETVNDLRGFDAVIDLDNNVVLMATLKLQSTIVGFGLAYAGTTKDATIPEVGQTEAFTSEGSASQLGFNLGIVSDISRNIKLDVAASILLPSASYKVSTEDDNETKASQTYIGVNARAFWKVNPNLRFVPIFTFLTVSGTIDSGDASTGTADFPSLTSFVFGGGLNYKIGDFLIAGGVSFSSNSLTIAATGTDSTGGTPELSNSTTLFPIWNVGAEWQILDWLYGRIGYTAITGKATVETTTQGSATAVSEFVASFFGPSQRGATLGVGFRFGDFSLDATVNEDVLRQGFNIVGGGGPTFVLVTTSYALP